MGTKQTRDLLTCCIQMMIQICILTMMICALDLASIYRNFFGKDIKKINTSLLNSTLIFWGYYFTL